MQFKKKNKEEEKKNHANPFMDCVVVLGWEIKSTNGALVCSYTYMCKESSERNL